jgi:hypothetical protein
VIDDFGWGSPTFVGDDNGLFMFLHELMLAGEIPLQESSAPAEPMTSL